MSSTHQSRIDIRLSAPEELGSILELVKVCYGDAAESEDWWRWRHFHPNLELTAIFVASLGQKIVGMRPMTLFRYCYLQRNFLGGLFSAVMVHPDFRRQGIFRRLVEACTREAFQRGADFVTTMPNEISHKGFMRMGWHDPGRRTLQVLPFDLPRLAQSRFHPGWLVRLSTAVPQRVLHWFSHSSDESPGLTIREIEAFEVDTNDLVSRISHLTKRLMIWRSHAWLSWRYQSNPWNEYRRFEARDASGILRGFVVTNLDRRDGLRVGYLLDLVGEDSIVRRTLVFQATQALRKTQADVVISVMSDPSVIRDLKCLGFWWVPQMFSPKKFFTVYSLNPQSASSMAGVDRIENWYQTLGDWDGV